MGLIVQKADSVTLKRWDDFVITSEGGTIFHTLHFLSYHRHKFSQNLSNFVWTKGEQLIAVMPAAQFEVEGKKVLRSPYGASFGGVVAKTPMKLKDAIALTDGLVAYCEAALIDEVLLSFPPQIYFSKNNDALFFSLERAGFKLKSRDVFSVVDIDAGYDSVWKSYEGRARTAVRKSAPTFELQSDACLKEFYSILVEDKGRLNSKPTHTLEELLSIKESFPDRVWCDLAIHKETGARAGICYFAVTENVVMTFYMSQETAALKLNGINVLVDFGIKRAIEGGFRHFDFGGSTVGYEVQNIGVANFKESFGAFSTSRMTYEWQRMK